LIGEQQSQGQREATIENLESWVREQWREWVGPIDTPSQDWAKRWASWLYMNDRSEAELMDRLKTISTNRWLNKDKELSWSEWSTAPRDHIRRTLELSHVDDDDPLLNRILTRGLQGEDAIMAIRNDDRFRSTNTMYRELSSTVAEIGKRFGFIAS